MSHSATVATQHWLEHTVIGLNFCPFAKREWLKKSIKFHESSAKSLEDALYELVDTFTELQNNPDIETTLLVYPNQFASFDDYLELLDYANQLLEAEGHVGTFQIASFHPDYWFDGLEEDDAANYTNRSPYPILHILREASVEKALSFVDSPESIPETNIRVARELGVSELQKLLTATKTTVGTV